AADAGDHHELLARDAELGEDLLHGGQDGVVAAARAPADLLVGLEVLLVEGRDGKLSGHASKAPGSRGSCDRFRGGGKGRPATLAQRRWPCGSVRGADT